MLTRKNKLVFKYSEYNAMRLLANGYYCWCDVEGDRDAIKISSQIHAWRKLTTDDLRVVKLDL